MYWLSIRSSTLCGRADPESTHTPPPAQSYGLQYFVYGLASDCCPITYWLVGSGSGEHQGSWPSRCATSLGSESRFGSLRTACPAPHSGASKSGRGLRPFLNAHFLVSREASVASSGVYAVAAPGLPVVYAFFLSFPNFGFSLLS
ncbi:hypothetical protein GQ53DRAFT_334617 [Thozetella sp. PMI_491]|nr:hypothetical protein GQ53DRAFT_334617 [Thozetella sp. PMI_491]